MWKKTADRNKWKRKFQRESETAKERIFGLRIDQQELQNISKETICLSDSAGTETRKTWYTTHK